MGLAARGCYVLEPWAGLGSDAASASLGPYPKMGMMVGLSASSVRLTELTQDDPLGK